MALVKCRECGREISDTAPSCPNCGAVKLVPKQPSKGFGIAVRAGLVILALFMIGKCMNTDDSLTSAYDAQQAHEAATTPEGTMGIDVLYRAYEENTIAADQQYKGRRYYINGTVKSINTNIVGRPYVVLDNLAGGFIGAQMSFNDDAIPLLSTLKPGDSIRGNCVVQGDIGKVPMLRDCYTH